MNTQLACHELLPARAGSVRGAGLTYDPRTRVLDLATDRKTDRRYAVAEIAVGPRFGRGRAFRLDKLTPGSDREESGYAVFVAAAGPHADLCGCKGFARWSHCSHADGLRAILANGWLETAAERPEPAPVTAADVDDMAAAAGAA